jgi:hypothetical protein
MKIIVNKLSNHSKHVLLGKHKKYICKQRKKVTEWEKY